MNLCEVYTSVQGEGPNTGKPTTFVRFGGCNLRCSGWGTGTLPDGTEVPGCDTVFAVYPEWRETWDSCSPTHIMDLIPREPRRVCLTGGEPLIQRTRDLDELVGRLFSGYYSIDLFTNGTQPLDKHPWTRNDRVTVIMDWKLTGSGEGDTFDINNLPRLDEKDALKFVCKTEADFYEAIGHLAWAENQGVLDAQVWFGPVWDHMDPGVLARLVETHYPEGRLNIQTHKYIWDPEEREK